ncbi:PREDICTED: acid phosphatase 1-like [Nicotiana attenuata]|uniref:Acid phosphatase 1 n=1 Tax=Nicotiana attenuata TaxID=49451 RepID=A0A1J6IKH7_NICAT|nr:PREDICTED: acid phosphatase 1-like [Nicotiana attenuata]OIT04788.1 acid phosphatase 1 [Nicotiana attenuata]
MRAFFFFLLISMAAIAARASHAESIPNQIHPLRPTAGSAGRHIPQINCLSWRLAVETNNIQNWKLVPLQCESYVGHYMLGKQYRDDCNAVVVAAIQYAKTLKIAKDGKDVWVFDIDETTLSNLPYYARSDVAFGATKFNGTKFDEWTREGKAPAVPGALFLYRTLLAMGIKPVFITGTKEEFKQVRIANLKKVGYHSWVKLILKGVNDTGSSVMYKSGKRAELVKAGYRIVGNIGDQWSDLLGDFVGDRTFKLPDPMYYIG